MTEFNKEKRYVVLKLSKLTDHQKTAIGAALAEINLDESAMPECVVVEHDWPNYQETWDAIQAIVEGRYVSNDALKSEAADAFGDGYYEGFLDGAKYHEQSDCNTDPAYLGEEAIRCSEIAEDEKSKRLGIVTRQELAAQVGALRGAAQKLLFEIACCTSPTVFDSFSGLQDAIAATPQQHLANLQAEAQSSGWQEYCWPEKVPPSKHEFYITDVGCLFYDNGAWLEPAEYNGWNPTSAEVTKFFVVPEGAAMRQGGAA